jgi:hypothetical protein
MTYPWGVFTAEWSKHDVKKKKIVVLYSGEGIDNNFRDRPIKENQLQIRVGTYN